MYHMEGRGQQGEAAWVGRSSAGWAAEVAWKFSCGKHLPHRYTSSALPGPDLAWVTWAKPGKSSLLSVPLLLVLQGLFQLHSISKKWGCLGKLVCETSRVFTSMAPLGSGVISPCSKVAVLIHSRKVWSGKHFWTWVSICRKPAATNCNKHFHLFWLTFSLYHVDLHLL